jgi:hypothetical protein
MPNTKTIPLTKGLSSIVDEGDFDFLNQWKWQAQSDGYAMRTEWDKNTKSNKCVLMHRLIMGTPQGMDTDHINRDRLDNRKSNLRICTRAENISNRGCSSNREGLEYVYKCGKKWKVMVTVGSYDNLEDAISARDNFLTINKND